MILLTPHRAKIQVWLSLLQQWTYRAQHLPPLFSDPFTLHPIVHFRLCQSDQQLILPVSLFLVTISPLLLSAALLFTSWSHFPFFSLPHCMPSQHWPYRRWGQEGSVGSSSTTPWQMPKPGRCAAARDVLGWQRNNFSAPNRNRAVLLPHLQVCVCLEGRSE